VRGSQRFLFAFVAFCALGSLAQARSPQIWAPNATGMTEADAAARIAAPLGVITSTFRTVAHNRDVGGVPNSYHLLGRALDIVRRPGVSHAQIAALLKSAGYTLVESLDEGDHSHFAFAPTLAVQAPVRSTQPPKPALPRLAADEHGTLLLDLQPQPQLAHADLQVSGRTGVRVRR
jgi:hypothetical protein